jgi:hypothetical protein
VVVCQTPSGRADAVEDFIAAVRGADLTCRAELVLDDLDCGLRDILRAYDAGTGQAIVHWPGLRQCQAIVALTVTLLRFVTSLMASRVQPEKLVPSICAPES